MDQACVTCISFSMWKNEEKVSFEGGLKGIYTEVCNKAFSYCWLICARNTE